jgi:hypothetical protein
MLVQEMVRYIYSKSSFGGAPPTFELADTEKLKDFRSAVSPPRQ